MLNVNALKAMACVFMVLDHMWATVIPENMWMTYVGRLAFPIFAFLITEGYRHTSDFRRYALRLLGFALVSEIPFNLMHSGSVFFPFHQNVMFTLLLGLVSIHSLDAIRQNLRFPAEQNRLKALTRPGLTLAGCLLLSVLGLVDYGFWGVMTMILFHLLRDFRGCGLLQLAAMIYINCEALKGMYIPVEVFGTSLEFATQGFAVLALIPIWLYNGKKGLSSRALQYCFYAFYPLHMLLLAAIVLF